MRIMGVDPGGKTGVVVWDIEGGMLHVEEMFAGGEHLAELVVCSKVVSLVSRYGVDLVVIEDFVLRSVPGGGGVSTARVALSPARIGFGIACLIAAAEGLGGVEVVLRPAGDAIAVMTNERLRRLGMYVRFKGGGEHVRDAARHVALELRKRR